MGEREGVTGHEVFPEDGVKIVVDALKDAPASLAEFTEGLGKHLHLLSMDPTPRCVLAALRFMHGWLLSVVVARDPEWHAQVAEHDRRVAAGESTPGHTGGELRALLSR